MRLFFKLFSIIYLLALNTTSRKAFPPPKPGSKAASPPANPQHPDIAAAPVKLQKFLQPQGTEQRPPRAFCSALLSVSSLPDPEDEEEVTDRSFYLFDPCCVSERWETPAAPRGFSHMGSAGQNEAGSSPWLVKETIAQEKSVLPTLSSCKHLILGEGSQAASWENKTRCKGWVSPARCALRGLCYEKLTGTEESPL